MYDSLFDSTAAEVPAHPRRQPEYGGAVTPDNLKSIFRRCADFESRTLRVGQCELFLCWLDGLMDSLETAETLLRPLADQMLGEAGEEACLQALLFGAVSCPAVARRDDPDALSFDLTHGRCALVFPGLKCALSFDLRGGACRTVGEPTLEKSLKGSRDSFVETLRANTALLRRHLATPRLKIAEHTLGRKSHTRLAVVFVEDVADPAVVRELARRLAGIDVDGVLSLGVLEEQLADRPLSPFPQLLHTEKPDRLARWLLDGRVGLLLDGVPIALVLPVSFSAFLRVGSEGSMNWLSATLLTALRYAALFLGLYLPALYAAVASFHQEMIPTKLLLSIVEAKRDVPFSTSFELIGMLLAFALLQEAGLRLPDPVGDTVSIIGALIVGQAAVEARLVSPIAIIVVAVSGIACYALPSQDLGAAVRLWRALLLLGGICAGLYGVALLSCLLAVELSSLESFGRSYTAPLSGEERFGMAALLVSPPLFARKLRDRALNTPDRRRQR